MANVKILLRTSIAGKDDNGNPIDWESDTEQECTDKLAKRLVESGQAEYVLSGKPAAKVKRKPTAKQKAVKTA